MISVSRKRCGKRLVICPVGAKTRSEAWQRAAEMFAEIHRMRGGARVFVRDGSFNYGAESVWIVARSAGGRYSAHLDQEVAP